MYRPDADPTSLGFFSSAGPSMGVIGGSDYRHIINSEGLETQLAQLAAVDRPRGDSYLFFYFV